MDFDETHRTTPTILCNLAKSIRYGASTTYTYILLYERITMLCSRHYTYVCLSGIKTFKIFMLKIYTRL